MVIFALNRYVIMMMGVYQWKLGTLVLNPFVHRSIPLVCALVLVATSVLSLLLSVDSVDLAWTVTMTIL